MSSRGLSAAQATVGKEKTLPAALRQNRGGTGFQNPGGVGTVPCGELKSGRGVHRATRPANEEMKIQLLPVGFDPVTKRDLYVLEIPDIENLTDFQLSSPRFICLLIWNTEKESDKSLDRVANWLLNLGAVYFCCWGNGGERVHDAIDNADIHRNPNCDPVVMTTWHSTKPLLDAAYFAMDVAFPNGAYAEGCASVIAVCVNNREESSIIRAAFTNPVLFRNQICPE